jgi:hypothetical protein
MRHCVEGFRDVKREKMNRSSSAVSTVKVVCKEVADVFGTALRAKTKSIGAEDTLRPSKEATVNNRFTYAKNRVSEVDGAPVGGV